MQKKKRNKVEQPKTKIFVPQICAEFCMVWPCAEELGGPKIGLRIEVHCKVQTNSSTTFCLRQSNAREGLRTTLSLAQADVDFPAQIFLHPPFRQQAMAMPCMVPMVLTGSDGSRPDSFWRKKERTHTHIIEQREIEKISFPT
jgi:hypothetical protein